jgi:hypothetical protein
MMLGKRRPDAEPVAEPTGVTAPPPPQPGPQSWAVAGDAPPARPAPADATVVEGHAVELPPVPGGAVAQEPVAVVSSAPATGGVAPLAETAPFYASGHAHGTAPSWPEPVAQLAAERPEVVVGAAFAGGLLFALILRRLGN